MPWKGWNFQANLEINMFQLRDSFPDQTFLLTPEMTPENPTENDKKLITISFAQVDCERTLGDLIV